MERRAKRKARVSLAPRLVALITHSNSSTSSIASHPPRIRADLINPRPRRRYMKPRSDLHYSRLCRVKPFRRARCNIRGGRASGPTILEFLLTGCNRLSIPPSAGRAIPVTAPIVVVSLRPYSRRSHRMRGIKGGDLISRIGRRVQLRFPSRLRTQVPQLF